MAEEYVELERETVYFAETDTARYCELMTPSKRGQLLWDQDAADNCDDFVVEFEAWLSVFHGQRDDRGEDCVDAGRRMDFRFSSDSEIDGDEAEEGY